MKIHVNNKEYELSEGATLQQLIETLDNIPQNGCAIAIDFVVVPKTNWDKVILKDGSNIMIIKAVSGG